MRGMSVWEFGRDENIVSVRKLLCVCRMGESEG